MTRVGGGRRGAVSDGDVIAASLTDPERFVAVVDAHGDAIYRYLARRVGPAAAEDLASETFLRAFRSRATYRGVGGQPTALPWLYGIATNLVRDHARHERRRLDTMATMASSTLVEPGTDRVDEAVTASLVLSQVVTAIASLSDTARDVLALVAVEGLTYTETAAALGVPEGTVRSRLSRARVELRRSLDLAVSSPGISAPRSPKGGCRD